ncbi:MAG: DUF1700 domain-containing protein [Oscillospiraceae bacterium]|nr:DUF1700 domain-containing protein [Oscillospiraceae bacterium]
MHKQEFLLQLRKKLSGLPQDDMEERLTFYSEMIEDRMEEGLSEEEAVLAVGSVDEIVAQVVADMPLAKIAKERIKPKRRLKAWEIVLLALGSPIWLSLAIAAAAVILSLYVSLWSVIISLWAVWGSLIGCALGSAAAGIVMVCNGNALAGTAVIGGGIVCAGLLVFLFFGCKAATKGILMLTKKFALWIKNCFMKKEKTV